MTSCASSVNCLAAGESACGDIEQAGRWMRARGETSNYCGTNIERGFESIFGLLFFQPLAQPCGVLRSVALKV